MSVTPDFCCDTKCLTIKKCDGPWCLEAPCSCGTQCVDNPATVSTDNELSQATLTVTSAACCGTVRCNDKFSISGSKGGTLDQDYTITHIANGVIVAAGDDGRSIRLEGYKGHLVHVKLYATDPEARDGLETDLLGRYHVHRKCSGKLCSVQVSSRDACSTDAPCDCPC